MPSGQDMSTVDVRRTEPGRRAGGATAGFEGGAVSCDTGEPSFRKPCFHSKHAFGLCTFPGTLLVKTLVKKAERAV